MRNRRKQSNLSFVTAADTLNVEALMRRLDATGANSSARATQAFDPSNDGYTGTGRAAA